jgi:hypothetical protein
VGQVPDIPADIPSMHKSKHRNTKRCDICQRYFRPDPRVGERQQACARTECQRKRKQRQEKRWREQHPDAVATYEDVREWRKRNPNYQRQWRAKRRSEIKTQYRPQTPVKSIRLHLRVSQPLGEIKTQYFRVSRSGTGLWVNGLDMQDINADGPTGPL